MSALLLVISTHVLFYIWPYGGLMEKKISYTEVC